MQKDVILTPEGLEKLKQEIEYLSTDKRREVAERIKEAREFGDISENSEYDDAKNEQAMLEARIASLEDKLRSASVIDATELSNDVVRVGSRRQRQGRGLRQVAPVHDRRLDRGQPGREPALQRVAGRQGAARQQAQRRSSRAAAERQGPQAQDHQDRRREGVSDESSSSSATRGASSPRCATRASSRSRTPSRAWRRSLRSRRRTRGSRPARRPTSARGSPAGWPRAAARARRRSSTSSTARGGCSCTRARDVLGAGVARPAASRSTSAT